MQALIRNGQIVGNDWTVLTELAAELGMARAFYKIAMRPGKPLMAGRLGSAAMLGLPGNPVSSMVCGHIFMLPLLRAMLGPLAARRPCVALLGFLHRLADAVALAARGGVLTPVLLLSLLVRLCKYTGLFLLYRGVTAASFAGLSLYGYTTKRDLSAFGRFLVMGVVC